MQKISTLIATLALAAVGTVAFAGEGHGDKPHGQGMHKMMDCSKMENAERKAGCEARQKAMETCKAKEGDERKQCMKDAMPKRDGHHGAKNHEEKHAPK